MVSCLTTFKGWNVPMSEIKRLTTPTNDVHFTVPNKIKALNKKSHGDKVGRDGRHVTSGNAGDYSTQFHQALRKEVIEVATSPAEFNKKFKDFLKAWNVQTSKGEPITIESLGGGLKLKK